MPYLMLHVMAWTALVALLLSGGLHYLHARLHRHPAPVRAVMFRWPRHLSLGMSGWVVATLLLILLTPRWGGGLRSHGLPHLSLGGGYSIPSGVSLKASAPPAPQQGATNACGSFSINVSALVQENERGEERPYSASAPFWTYAHTPEGASNGYTSFGDNLSAIQRYGLTPLWTMPNGPWITTEAIGQARPIGGSGYMLPLTPDAVAAAVAAGHPVTLLTHTYSDFYNAWGQSETCNGGSYEFDHWISVVGYRRDATGYSFLIENSWGSNWGTNGFIWLCPSAWSRTVMEADVYSIGAPAWPLRQGHRTVAVPLVRPHVSRVRFQALRQMVLRAGPRDWPRTRLVIKHGAILQGGAQQTPHWQRVVLGNMAGWLERRYLRRLP